MAKDKKVPDIIELKMFNAHSLFVGNKPDSVKCSEGLCENILSEKSPEDMASFGLFGGSADVNKFYPNISAEEWTPKDSDFITPLFRAFSETTVLYMGIPIDFSEVNLQASMSMLKGVTVNTNHDTETENAVGAISAVSWQPGYRANGVEVPAGINAVLKIDAKSNPRLARAILMDPPAIHSNSVTVRFAHKKSHDVEGFWDKVGSFDDKGQMYRLIATEIKGYKETSLVSHGADPFAQIIKGDDGVIQDPKYASSVYNFKETSFNYKPHKKGNMEFTDFLAKLGLSIEDYPDMEALTAHFTALQENQLPEETDLEALNTANDELVALKAIDPDLTPDSLTTLKDAGTSDEATLTEEQTTTLSAVDELGGIKIIKEKVALGDAHLTDIRSKAVADYKLVNGETAQAVIIETIQNSTLPQAQAFEIQFAGDVEKNIPLTCQKCGSNDVTRGSFQADNGNIDKKADNFTAIRDKHHKEDRKKPSDIHKK